jgi:hypothetical protein
MPPFMFRRLPIAILTEQGVRDGLTEPIVSVEANVQHSNQRESKSKVNFQHFTSRAFTSPRELELPPLAPVLGPFFAYVRLSARENLRR